MSSTAGLRLTELLGIEPLASARVVAAQRLGGAANVRLLDPSEWDRIPTGAIDLITSHEMLYLEARRVRFYAACS